MDLLWFALDMKTAREHRPTRGVVVSDLHLFARRSRGAHCFDSIRPELASATLVVLNGDIFDFRWSTLRDLDTTVAAAMEWLRDLLETFPQCRVHYILGNHDWFSPFRGEIAALARHQPRLRCHEHGVRLGDALFLHGDCAHRKMDAGGLGRYRQCWDNDRRHGALRTGAYLMADRLGITQFTHARWFPRERTVERIVHYLDRAWPVWRHNVRDCYFGHTHLPFSDYRHDGVAFHNTGSAIRGLHFNPITFEVHDDSAEPLLASKRNGHGR